MQNREKLGSRLGFILLSAGCAIGCGNVWKFPWLTGTNGGGAFVLVYILCLIVLGLPILTMEFAIGRASQASIVRSYQKLEKPGQKWHIHGGFALFGNICLMAFYVVVAGWILYYFVKVLGGQNAELSFGGMLSSVPVNVGFMLITVTVGFFVLCFNLQGGLERVTKIMMPILFVLMIGLAIYCCLLPGAVNGLKFYLVPDFGKLNGKVIVAAMNQAFFTLGLGVGSMSIFGSYIDKNRTLLGESVNIITLDTLVALCAGLIIFPACFANGLSSNDMAGAAGPGLLFVTMSNIFNGMGSVGRWCGTAFFLFMTFAAFSTVLSVFENILACVRELTGWSRPKGCLACGIVVALAGLTTAFGYCLWPDFHPFNPGTNVLDLWDFVLSYNLLPLGALIFAMFCCSKKYGWGWDNFVAEANAGKGLKVKNWVKPIFSYVVPVIIVFLWVYGLITFNW